jgi:hypothetical protein
MGVGEQQTAKICVHHPRELRSKILNGKSCTKMSIFSLFLFRERPQVFVGVCRLVSSTLDMSYSCPVPFRAVFPQRRDFFENPNCNGASILRSSPRTGLLAFPPILALWHFSTQERVVATRAFQQTP